MAAAVRDGWLTVPYSGPELVVIEVGVGQADHIEWRPAFLDWVGGKRVAKIRPPTSGTVAVWLRTGGVQTRVGKTVI